jgi:hypothetical protein
MCLSVSIAGILEQQHRKRRLRSNCPSTRAEESCGKSCWLINVGYVCFTVDLFAEVVERLFVGLVVTDVGNLGVLVFEVVSRPSYLGITFCDVAMTWPDEASCVDAVDISSLVAIVVE